jgi:hypothetical protein
LLQAWMITAATASPTTAHQANLDTLDLP